MEHILDRPVWSALVTSHASLAVGEDRARRYPGDIVPFACARDGEPESLAALAELVQPQETVFFLQADPILLPPTLKATTTAFGVQMLAQQPMHEVEDERIKRLVREDAAEMLALARLTNPGPFTMKAMELGAFWGVKREGRLIAMAGERMRQDGYAEISGVCVHPDAQGEGLGKALSRFVAGKICSRGEQPYLHSYETNGRAIALYQSIGFALRQRMNVAAVQRVE